MSKYYLRCQNSPEIGSLNRYARPALDFKIYLTFLKKKWKNPMKPFTDKPFRHSSQSKGSGFPGFVYNYLTWSAISHLLSTLVL
jgi:hypothetical protein